MNWWGGASGSLMIFFHPRCEAPRAELVSAGHSNDGKHHHQEETRQARHREEQGFCEGHRFVGLAETRLKWPGDIEMYWGLWRTGTYFGSSPREEYTWNLCAHESSCRARLFHSRWVQQAPENPGLFQGARGPMEYAQIPMQKVWRILLSGLTTHRRGVK